jgi:hypothetical protein
MDTIILQNFISKFDIFIKLNLNEVPKGCSRFKINTCLFGCLHRHFKHLKPMNFFLLHKTNTLLNCVCIHKIFQNLCIYIFFYFASRQRHYFFIFQDEIFSIRISWCQSDKKVVLCLEYSKSV